MTLRGLRAFFLLDDDSLLRSRLCRRVTLYVFLSVLAIEAIVFFPSYANYRTQILEADETALLATLTAGIQVQRDERPEALLVELERRAGDTALRGAALFGDDGRRLGSFGEALQQRPQGAAVTGQERVWLPQGDRYELRWSAAQSGLPFALVARIDSTPIDDRLGAFTLRILMLILVISAFVCAATMLIVGKLVLEPTLRVRANLAATEASPVQAVAYVLPRDGDDEIGEMLGAINRLFARLSDKRRQERRESERRFKDFADATSDWFWEMDENLRFSYFSERFTEITGVPQEKLLGKTRQETGIPDVDEASWRRQLDDLANHRPFRNFIHPRTKSDGEVVWLCISGKPYFDDDGRFLGFRGTGSDVTEGYRAEQALRGAKEEAEEAGTRLVEAIEAMSDGFALFDREERLVLCNSQLCEMFRSYGAVLEPGASFESIARTVAESGAFADAIGREEAWVAERLEAFRDLRSVEQRLIDGGWVRTSEHRTKDGGTVSLRADITELKDREARLRDATRHAEAANDAKSIFLANMSHELRTPLNAIIGFSEMIATEQLGPIGTRRYQTYANDIHASGQHLLDIINDILDISKIEAGKAELTEEVFAIHEVVASSVALVSRLAAAQGIAIENQVPANLPLVMGDEIKLRQVFLNILSNAVKFSPDGGRVVLRASLSPNQDLELSVADTGIGMTEDQVPLALTAFGQVGGALSKSSGGVGLGLPLTKAMVELHGGSLEITSRINVGTRVTVRLPSNRLVQDETRMVGT